MDTLPEIDGKPNQVAILQEETPKDMTMRKSVSMAKIARMLVIPNQAIQTITVDSTSGAIKQVHNLGNNDEIIITQGIADESGTKSRAVQSHTKKTNDRMNSLTVKVDKYNITIEGKKTLDELQKITESLIEKDMEQ